jgi:hypothetical protein
MNDWRWEVAGLIALIIWFVAIYELLKFSVVLFH